jgi:hypothetical protein
MTVDQHALAESILGGYVELDDGVPADFEAYVREQIAARPSPVVSPDSIETRLTRLEDATAEILTLLRGGNPE